MGTVLPWPGVLFLATYVADPGIARAEDFYCPKGKVDNIDDPKPEEVLCEPMGDPACVLNDLRPYGQNWLYSCLLPANEAMFNPYRHGCYKASEIGFYPERPVDYDICLCRKSHCDPRYPDVEPPRTTVSSSGCGGERSMITDRIMLILFTIAAAAMKMMLSK